MLLFATSAAAVAVVAAAATTAVCRSLPSPLPPPGDALAPDIIITLTSYLKIFICAKAFYLGLNRQQNTTNVNILLFIVLNFIDTSN